MDFASAASSKTKATPDFGASANLAAPSETAPGVFAKQLIGALKLTKASDIGRPSPQAEAVREAREAHDARQARRDERIKAGRAAKAERPERMERPERAEEARFDRKPVEKNDEPRDVKAADKTERPAKAQQTDKPKSKPETEASAEAKQPADPVGDAAETADTAAEKPVEAAVDDGDAVETTVAEVSNEPDKAAAAALLVNPLQIALQAAEDAPGPIAVTLLQAASAALDGDRDAALDGDVLSAGKPESEDPAATLQGLLSGAPGRQIDGAEDDAANVSNAAKGAAQALAGQQRAATGQAAAQSAQHVVDAAEAFEQLLAAKVEAQGANAGGAKAAGDALGFANQVQAAGAANQKPVDALPIATTQQAQTAQSQTGAKLDQPLAARSTAYLPPSEQVAVQIRRAAEQGASRISIELDPAELGRVEVRLDVDRLGRVAASVVAERPETLDLLQKDQRSLEKALQNAGLSADASNLSFSLREGNKGGREAHDGQGSRDRGGRDGQDNDAKPIAAEVLGRMRPINLDRALDIIA